MSDESIHYSFRCHLVDDADISSVLDAASRLERSRLIKRLLRAGIAREQAVNRTEWKSSVLIPPSSGLSQDDVHYEDDPDVSQIRNSHFHPAPKPGAKK